MLTDNLQGSFNFGTREQSSKGKEGKFRLIINMRYVNAYLVKNKFKVEGLKNLSDLAEKGDNAVSFDLTSWY